LLFVPKPKVALVSPQSGAATQPVSDAVTANATAAPLIANARQKEDVKADAKTPDAASAGAASQKIAPISVFVSRKLSKLFVRQGFVPVFDSAVTIKDAAEPMGTHVFTAMEARNDGAAMRWTVVTVPEKPSHPPAKPQRGHAQQAV